MAYGEPELLFYKHDMHSVMEAHRQGSAKAVHDVDADRLLNSPTDDVVAEILQTYILNVPVLRRDDAYVDQREGQVPVRDYFARDAWGERGVRNVTGTIVDLTVPFTGDKDFFFIRPTTYDSSPPRSIVGKDTILIRASGRDMDPEGVKSTLNNTLADIEKYLGWLRGSADPFNESLPAHIRSAIEARKSKLLKDRNMVASLGFNLKPRAGAPKTFIAPVTRKKIVPASRISTAPFKPEPILDEANYGHILTIMQSMAQVMELSPSAFVGMDEESLRQHFLVQLNGQFEGAATGETFNFTGKTDILIRVDGKNIFIAECKFWGGEKVFLETIDQLLGYLSWRDTKAAVVVFNRNKDFTAVLKTIELAVAKHPHIKHGPKKESETRFRAVFGNPTDHSREVIVTILAFDVPKN